MLSGLLAVHENLRFLIDAFKVEFHNLTFGRCEFLSVFALTCGIPASSRTGSTAFGIGSRIDVPVMG